MKIHEGFMKIYKVELNLQLEKVLESALSINQHHGVWQGIWSLVQSWSTKYSRQYCTKK